LSKAAKAAATNEDFILRQSHACQKKTKDGAQPSELSAGALALLYTPNISYLAVLRGRSFGDRSIGAHDKHARTESRAAMVLFPVRAR
jgi:hypothetical protein